MHRWVLWGARALVFLRLTQGLAVGGEYGSGSPLMWPSMPPPTETGTPRSLCSRPILEWVHPVLTSFFCKVHPHLE